MASTLSNLYVEKASSEHPTAMWMLNEQVDYISHISEANRPIELFANWSVANGEAVADSSSDRQAPFVNSSTSKIIGLVPENFNEDQDDPANITLTGKFNFANNFTPELFNFSIGLYVYLETALANTFSIGYKYTLAGETVEVLSTKNVTSRYLNNWIFASDTFDIPPAGATNIRLLIRLNVSEGGAPGAYNFLINGLSVGQWSEDYNKTSFGVTTKPIPSNIALPSTLKSLTAFSYGTSGDNAHYLSTDNLLSAKNFGIPLVFGSNNVTQITENVKDNVNYPSLIFPGYGFLNERGKYNPYTVEMWLRINSESANTKRIFGPIGKIDEELSSDGLYVDGPFLSLKIGNSVGSHFVGDWFRPMLIHIRVSKNSAVLLLNGEEVINLTINQETITFPDEFNNIGQSQDWLGFYAYEDINPIDIDTFSIYSYPMPTVIAKRRWVWGQAVTAPEQTNSPLNSITAFNDYAFANYTSNYNYPDFANWKQAYFSNVNAESKALSLPQYALPAFRLEGVTINLLGSKATPEDLPDSGNFADAWIVNSTGDTYVWDSATNEWYNLGQNVGPLNTSSEELFEDIHATINPSSLDMDDVSGRRYITLSPNGSWNSNTDHIYFNSFSILNEQAQTVYGVFKTTGGDQDKTLIKIVNKNNGNNIRISINNNLVSYQAIIGGTTQLIKTKTVNSNEKFCVGLDIRKIFQSQNININRFFSDQSSLEMYVGGDGVSKFTGKIYKVGLDAPYNSRKTLWMYDDDGIMNPHVSYSISGSTSEDQEITFTTSTKHNYLIGDRVNIKATNSSFNLNEQEVISLTDNTFTVANPSTNSYGSGTTVTDSANILNKHTANYTLTAIKKYGLFFPDIAVAGYWEDYMPLSYFGKTITNYDLSSNYELDMIQYNQDFPEPPKFLSTVETSLWNYEDLRLEYSEPILLTYEDLNNDFYTGWKDYAEMSDNTVRTTFYETKESNLRSYVSFQKVKDGANRSLADFSSFAKPLTSGIIDPSEFELDWQETAFETTTGTLIYPPRKNYLTNKDVDFNDYALVYHLEFKSEGINHQPIRFRELQLASQVYESTDFTPVGSRFGIPVYYYSKSGIYFDLKAKNPVATYKKSTPYLYLDRHSGWKIKGKFDTNVDRGIAIPVNLPAATGIEVSSIQLWVRFSEEQFPEEPVMVFSIDHNDGIYDFFVQSDGSTKRGFIFAVDRDSAEVVETIEYYVNGESVSRPYIGQKEWSMIGLQFGRLLDFNNRTGLINLNGPLTYNNVSYNLATNIEKNLTREVRSWEDISTAKNSLVTGAIITGSNVTYTADNTLQQDEKVVISGIIPAEFNNVGATVISATATSFVVAKNESLIAGTLYGSGGKIEYGDWGDPQKINLLTGIAKTKNSQITNAAIIGERVRYTAANTLRAGDIVFISGITHIDFNKTNGTTVVYANSTYFETIKDSTLTTQVYTSGGTAQYAITPTSWENAEIIVENLVFSIDPKAIYEKYTGSNRIVVDDDVSSPKLLVDPERIRVYKDVSWLDRLKVPL